MNNNIIVKINTSDDDYYLNPPKFIYNKEHCVLLNKEINEIKQDKPKSDNTIIFKLIANEQITSLKKILIKSQYDINIQDIDGDTPLHMSVFMGNFDICEVLIKHNANINIKDKWGQTPCHRICFGIEKPSIIKIVDLFCDYQQKYFKLINIWNECDKHYNTPLHLVIKYILKNKIKVKTHIKLLLKKLIKLTNINLKNKDDMSPQDLLKLINYDK